MLNDIDSDVGPWKQEEKNLPPSDGNIFLLLYSIWNVIGCLVELVYYSFAIKVSWSIQ